MRVFLDFDGVLRPQGAFASRLNADCAAHFADAVLGIKGARIVVSSTWRLVYGLEALRRFFPAALRPLVEGATPDLGREYDEHVRHHECFAYLARRGLHGTRWIAVDDNADEFRPGAPLLLVDAARGFCADDALRLRGLYARQLARSRKSESRGSERLDFLHDPSL